jgi:hypothetical protein
MKQPTKIRPRNPESGYALLLVFAMAAIVAITLYTQVPRVAFEAQRDKEQMLMDRGHEYVRGIKLFVRKFNRFPGSLDDLENTNNQRFLRRRYVDPMTGKAEWRLLHAGPGGVITDSILSAKKTDASSQPSNFITEIPMFVNSNGGDSQGVSVGLRTRPSDQPGAAGSLSASGDNGGGGDAPIGNSPSSGIPGYNGPVMVLPDGRIVPASTTGTFPPPGGAPGAPGMTGATGFSGLANLPSGVAIQQNGLNPLNPLNGAPGGAPQPGGPPSAVSNMLNQILTTPRPGGLNGLGGVQAATTQGTSPTSATTSTAPGGSSPMGTPGQPGQTAIGAGIAGVASKKEQKGIKLLNDHQKYNEWEFVYDIQKEMQNAQQNAMGAVGASGAQGNKLGTTPGPGGPSTPGQTTNGTSTTPAPTTGQ